MNALLRTTVILFLNIVAFFYPPLQIKTQSISDMSLPIDRDLATHVSDDPVPPLAVFLDSLTYTGGDGVLGVYVPGTLAMPVVQQPKGIPQFVSQRVNVVTQFELATLYENIGLLAHSQLGGAKFHLLDRGQLIYLISGDENVQIYVINEILQYQALTPNSFNSDFISLDYPGDRITARDLFFNIYVDRGGVILQTCITSDGVLNWGRLFIIAIPHDTWWLERLGFGH